MEPLWGIAAAIGAGPPAGGTGCSAREAVAAMERLRETATPFGAGPPAGGTGSPAQAVVAHVGPGDASHLATHTEGFSYTLPLGPWHSSTLTQLLGSLQGTMQAVHAGATAAFSFLRFRDIAYRASVVQPFRYPVLMWVDDTMVLLKRRDTRPIQGVLLDQGILWVNVPDCKIQHGSTSEPQPLRSPTLAAVTRHMDRGWITDSPKQREEALAGAPDIQSSRVVRYMGTNIYLGGTPTAPCKLPEVCGAVWKQLHP